MIAFLSRIWRFFATALSFVLFGLGGVLIPLVVIPFIYLLSANKVSRQRRGQAFIHRTFKLYVAVMKSLGVLTYEVHGIEKLADAKLVLANHPSLIDVVFLISLIPNANCVVKGALLRNPFTRGPIKAAGYIVNHDAADDVIEEAKQAFNRHEALIVFPEGTRTKPGHYIALKRGAANIAIRTQVDVTPVIIRCEPLTLTKGEAWHRIPNKRPHFTIEVKDVISTSSYIDDKPLLAARTLTTDLTVFFNQEMELHGQPES